MGKKNNGDNFEPNDFSFGGDDVDISSLPLVTYRGDFVDHILTCWLRNQGVEHDVVFKWTFNSKGEPIMVRGYEYGTETNG